MAQPWSNRDEARLFIGDTGGLLNDVVQATRRRQATSLIMALNFDAVLLYIPRHVLGEVEKHLQDYPKKVKQQVDLDAAVHTWRTLYAPFVRVVDVPEEWGTDDPRVRAVIDRHPTDAPTAQLASALAPCYVLARDSDLTDHFGQHEHLPLLHAAANSGELNYVSQSATVPVGLTGLAVGAAWRGFGRLPDAAQAGVLLAVGALAYVWQRDGRAARHLKRVRSIAEDVLEVFGPPLVQLGERLREGVEVWASHVVTRSCPPSLSEAVARVLAHATDKGMLAGEIARALDMPGSIKDRTAAVRTVLEEYEAFTEVTPWRWLLGHPITNERPEMPMELMMDWFRRVHRDVLRRPEDQDDHGRSRRAVDGLPDSLEG